LVGAKDIKTTKSGETISPPRIWDAADAKKHIKIGREKHVYRIDLDLFSIIRSIDRVCCKR